MSTATGSWIGTTLADGRYHVTRVLGEGGMGVAYLAWDNRLETEVVLKVPHRHLLTSPEVVQRFAREIRSLVALSHPHVVRVTDVAEHEGVPYSVLQYLSGGSLDDRLRQLPPHASLWQRCELLLGWLEPIAQALDFVHSHGCVHRDVKPANILFDKYGNAYLADFGVAKTIADQQNAKQATALTGQGMVLGTPDYMAPELITANQFDGRVDQYALAFTVFEVLAGRLPLSAPSPTAMLVAHATQRPTHLVEVMPAIPNEVAAAVARGMAKNPAERHASCHAFAIAVTTVLRSAPRAALEAAQVTGQIVQESARLACPACNAVLRVLPNLRGQCVPCSRCRTPLWVAPDLQRLELAASVPGATAVEIPPPPVATVPTSAIPVPTLPVGTTTMRSGPLPPPLVRPGVHSAFSESTLADDPPARLSMLAWGLIGSVTGIAALAVLYFGLLGDTASTPTSNLPSDTQVAESTPSINRDESANSSGATEAVTPPAPAPVGPSINTPVPAPVNPPVTTQNTTGAVPPNDTKPNTVGDRPPVDTKIPPSTGSNSSAPPSSPPKKPALSPIPAPPPPDPPSTTSVVVKPPLANQLAQLPKQFALPELVTGEKPRVVKFGAVALKADETLELKLLTDVAGVKAKRATTPAAAIPGLPAKREYRFELTKGSQPSLWHVVGRHLAPPGGKPEPDVPVGEFFVTDGQLQFQWQASLDEAVANPLRSAVLVASVGATERAIALRDVIRQPPLVIDLDQKVTTVKLNNVKGLPPREAIWLEVLDARDFPGPLTYDPAEKRVQGRKLDLVLYPTKPRVWVDINVNVSPSGGAALFKPLYEALATPEDFTTEHLDKFVNIDQAIRANEIQVDDLDSLVRSQQTDLQNTRAADPTDINQVQAAAAKQNRLRAQINSNINRARGMQSLLVQLRAIRESLPTIQNMRRVHQQGRLSYRVYYIVGNHEVDVLRAEDTQP